MMRPASLATATSEEECRVSSHLLAIAAPGAKWPDEGSDAWLKVGNQELTQGILMRQPVINDRERKTYQPGVRVLRIEQIMPELMAAKSTLPACLREEGLSRGWSIVQVLFDVLDCALRRLRVSANFPAPFAVECCDA